MHMPTHRKFIALVISAAILITGLTAAAPARADSDEIGRILAGLAALAIIGVAIDRANDNDPPVVTRRQSPYTQPGYRGAKPRPVPPRVARQFLPQHCLRTFHNRGQRVRVFGQRCLQRNYRFANQLPRACQVQYWNGQRGVMRTGYAPRCLRRNGYRIARN